MIQDINSNSVPILGNTIDKSQVPPIHQKRILAFVNHFIVSTCSFLNEFIVNCETKFIDFERKLQRVEASLVIIESKVIIFSTFVEATLPNLLAFINTRIRAKKNSCYYQVIRSSSGS